MTKQTGLRRTLIALAAIGTLAVVGCSTDRPDDETTTSVATSSSEAASTTSKESSVPSEATEAEPAPTMPDEEPEAAPDVEAPVEQVPEQAPAPAPASAPAYGVPCSESQLLQPATGADGTSLVCVGMGANAGPVWVYGPEGQGAGTAVADTECADGESGGQDEAGRMMMCSNGTWIYGP